MKKDLCEIIVVADRSGSMNSIVTDAIGAFNNFLNAQKKLPGDVRFTYVQFDDIYEMIHNGVPLQNIPELNAMTYVPRGTTALLDAVGKTIDDVGKRLSDTPEEERPEKILFVILTDGAENASKMYTRQQIFNKIQLQRDTYKWDFIFLAAGADAFAEATAIGIYSHHTYSYTPGSGVAMHSASIALDQAVANYRSSGVVDFTQMKLS